MIQRLMQQGLTEYEARAWAALLQNHPATAYETARGSGIPSAKIYPVLDRLVQRNLILEMDHGGKKRYIPCDPLDFLAQEKERSEANLQALKRDFQELEKPSPVSYLWNLQGRDAIMNKAQELIHQARSSILISLWAEETQALVQDLGARIADGVGVAMVHFGPPQVELPGAMVYEHPIADTLYTERGGRGFSMVVDGNAGVMGTLPTGGTEEEAQGAWSTNTGFALLMEDYIKHDIYILKIVQRYGVSLEERFGPGFRRLRDIFTNQEEE